MTDHGLPNAQFQPSPADVAAFASEVMAADLPPTTFASTAGRRRSLRTIAAQRSILYIYPRTSSPAEPAPADWDLIPGAKGCTAESCAFRDFRSELASSGYDTFGLSAQNTDYQREAADRLHLNFELLSDPELHLAHELGLPTFEAGSWTLYRRITLLLEAGRITKVFYPILNPENHPKDVLQWIADHEGTTSPAPH